jgi:hypothetical protein
VLLRALARDLPRRTESAAKLASDLRRCAGLVDPIATVRPAREPARPGGSPDLLPLDEDRGWGVWWLLAGLGGALGIAVYLWLR